eukprot:5457075-Amphidinium_carterae.1
MEKVINSKIKFCPATIARQLRKPCAPLPRRAYWLAEVVRKTAFHVILSKEALLRDACGGSSGVLRR